MSVEGNKNAALPLLAACLLTAEECVLTNVPRIGDVEVMARLLLDVGAEVDGIGSTTLRVRAPHLTTHVPDRGLVQRLRGSVLLLGPLLARLGKAHIAPPGGDFPARRTIAMFSPADRSRNPLTSAPAEKNFSLADLTTPTTTSAAATRPIAASSSTRKAGS